MHFMITSGRNYIIIVLLVLAVILFTTMKASIYFKKKTLQFMFGKIKEEDKEDIVSFGWDFVSGNGYNYKNGKDIRIYKSYKLMERWCTDAFHNKKIP